MMPQFNRDRALQVFRADPNARIVIGRKHGVYRLTAHYVRVDPSSGDLLAEKAWIADAHTAEEAQDKRDELLTWMRQRENPDSR